MRGQADPQLSMLSLQTPEQMVPADHPLRRVKQLADEALKELSPVFDEMYASTGRHSVPPETLLKGSLLMALFTVRSERMLCEQLRYNMLFRWFLDMNLSDEPFDHSTFSKNRERIMDHDVSRLFFERVVAQATKARLMSSEHFTVDGTLIEAAASLKSFRPKEEVEEHRRKERNRRKAAKNKRKGGKGPRGGSGGSNPTVSFHGQKRRNDTHQSTTDPEAKLFRKGYGKEAKLCFSAHALMENRNGLLVDLRIAEANGRAEREVALEMLSATGRTRRTVGADKGYDTTAFVEGCRERGVTPHVAQHNNNRRSRVDERTTRHAGYSLSQRVRKRVEEIFGWAKTVGGFRRTRFKGQRRTQAAAYIVGAAYNLMRMTKLLPAAV
ncbi:MAG: IS5 family transposase [Polyangiaceae bacterium]